MLDYETLRPIWWLLLGVLLIGFAFTDGYDLGVGIITGSKIIQISSDSNE